MWKRWLALLLAGMLVLCMTGCRRTGGGEPSDQKINVYTSKDYQTKDFVAQLGNVDYVGLVEEILANTKPVDSVPDRTPDYIVQILPAQGDRRSHHLVVLDRFQRRADPGQCQ